MPASYDLKLKNRNKGIPTTESVGSRQDVFELEHKICLCDCVLFGSGRGLICVTACHLGVVGA